jgi:drug/metabolite transporter (DMT)-like permease
MSPASASHLPKRASADSDDEQCPLLDHASETQPLVPRLDHKAVEEQAVPAAVLKGLALALLWIMTSSCMIFYVKFLMHPDRFPFASMLTAFHMGSGLVLSASLWLVAPGFFPSAPSLFGNKGGSHVWHRCIEVLQALLPFAPLAVLGALGIVFTNTAYRFADVSFLQMVKESQVVVVYVFMVIFGLEVLRARSVVVLAIIAACAVVAVRSAATSSFSTAGLFIQLLAGLIQSLCLVLANWMMSSRSGGKVDPLTMVLCTSPIMLMALLPVCIFCWDPRIPERFATWWPYLLGNVLLAFALQVAQAVTIKAISATGQALASVLKDLVIVAAARWFVGESITCLQAFGFAGSIIGISVFSAMKIKPAWFEKS